MGESDGVEFSLNVKQAIVLLWTLIAVVISLVVTVAVGWPTGLVFGSAFGGSWGWSVLLFFAVFLVVSVPVYLLMAVWVILSNSEGS